MKAEAPHHYKILVTGPFGAGKSRLIRTISEIEVVSTERRLTRPGSDGKDHTTVAMDYGRVTLGEAVLHLTGTPGQARFDFMWDLLSEETDGVVLVVDSTRADTFAEARRLLARCTAHRRPFVIAANKQDLPKAASLRTIQKAIAPEAEGVVLPCVGTRAASVRQVLTQLVEQV
jgi:small GTP-binding protein